MNSKTNELLNKLDDMAMGRAYHGDACAEILRTFILTPDERALIERFRDATHTGTDHIALQDFVIETRRNERD
jgi:hypothetical protein